MAALRRACCWCGAAAARAKSAIELATAPRPARRRRPCLDPFLRPFLDLLLPGLSLPLLFSSHPLLTQADLLGREKAP